MDFRQLGMVVVMGDVRAHHLGSLAGARGQGVPGILVEEILRRCKLYAVSQSEIATGPA